MDVICPPTLDAQYAVLGSMLIEPEIIGEVVQLVRESDFTDPTCRTVYSAIQSLYIAETKINAVVVLHALGDESVYRKYLSDLMEITPTSAGWRSYADIMREQAELYRIHMIGDRMSSVLSTDDVDPLLDQLNQFRADETRKIVSLADGFKAFLSSQSRAPEYIEFGIDALDDKLYVQRGDMVVIGARPSVGKTAFAIQIARHMGKRYKIGFFSLETSSEKFYDRYVSNCTGINFSRIKNHELDEHDWDNLNIKIRNDMKNLRIELIEAAGMSVAQIRRLSLFQRYDIIIIDYLQLVESSERDSYSRATQISMGLHTFAQRSKVCVIALSQLKRVDSQRASEPTLSDFRDSGQIEQDADVAFLMWLEKPEVRGSARILNVAKNKEGLCGKIRMLFDGSRQRFDVEPEEESDVAAIGSEPSKPPESKPQQMQLFGMPKGSHYR